MWKKFFLTFFAVALFLGPSLAKEELKEELIELPLKPVHKDTPFFTRANQNEQGMEYPIKMVKIQGNSSIVTPPATKANVLYFGQVKLGGPSTEYGILMDLEGKEKLLWVDSDADGDYAEETPYQIFKSDRTPGYHFFYTPVPLVFQVKFQLKDTTYQIPLQFDLPYLLTKQSGFEDLFYLKSRTWFIGVWEDKGEELQLALVDANDNGNYNDPEDLIFQDLNYNLHFSVNEGKFLKITRAIKTELGSQLKTDFQFCPEKLILIKGDR